ncbi:MAG: ABC-2 type transport system permease protein [Parcubacteria bacterium C7867-001]|nr:MAG: ABC-2 type transport system permease protein [Parcubacteria bacterium C7867-001]
MHSPALIGYYTMVRKDVFRIFRIWTQTLLPPVITNVLYFTIFGTFIGSQLQEINGHSYMQFIVPGLVMMTIITSAYMNTVSTFYFAKFIKNIEELLVSPMPSWVIVAGFVTGGVVRSFLVGTLVILTSLFFTHIVVANVLIIFAAAFLTSFLFSLAGLVNGFFANSFDAISIIPTFVLTPLTYLGGVFYSIEALPPFFKTLSLLNPILYMVNAFRYGFLGFSDVPIDVCFYVLGGLTVLFFGITLALFIKGTGFKN